MKSSRLVGVLFALCLAMLVFVSGASPAANDQVKTRTTYVADWYYSPAEFPCLTETIHVTGTFEERLHVIVNPGGGYSFQVSQTTQDTTAVGLTTGETYQYNGPMSWVEQGTTDEPWVTFYPFEITFNNRNHFSGPGGLQNFSMLTVWHITLDRSTGAVKVEVVKEDVRCQ